MVAIAPPVERSLIKSELTTERFLRKTNKAGNEIYVVDAHNSPHTMREIARLREMAYRDSGGGNGTEIDIDDFDTMDEPYQQLVLWDPDSEEIIGGYRFIEGEKVTMKDGHPNLATAHIFQYSDKFIKDYLPYTIELGRSFIQPQYQSASKGVKSLFSLDNLWDGLGALTLLYPKYKYFFGKVTMYPSFDAQARDLILTFINHFFYDKDHLVYPYELSHTPEQLKEKESLFDGLDYKEAYKVLNTAVRIRNGNVPALVNAYMSLSSTMKSFGTTIDKDFSNVYETAILITIDD
ncbi:MAG: GNAT family N-acetyltransferase, partial [Prevotellaceae bacterium]|nr:GNAT family N-acetyltransferase [Prevotellaceae bacterium]